MANRFFNQFGMSLEKNPVTLWANVAIGAAGVPTISAVNSKGIKSISRVSAGRYLVTFGVGNATDIYNRLFNVHHRFLNTTAPAAGGMFVVSQATATAGTITIQFVAADGTTATDPGNGETLMLTVQLKNSTAQ